jgi:predicted MFS family arabinose efflux permease
VITERQQQSADVSVVRLLGISISARLLVDTGVQTFNPFLPIIATGLGVDIVTMGRLLGVQNLTGLLSPLLGSLAERRGYRLVMRLSLLAGALGFLSVGLSRHLVLALFGMVLIGLCLAGFIPTLVAYLSARLPYHRRARGLGILEYSWALSGMIGMMLVAQLINLTGWRTPFFVLAAGLLVMVVVFGALPPGSRSAPTQQVAPAMALSWRQQMSNFFDLGANARSAYSAILASSLNFFAIMQFNLVYGAWLTDQYGVGPLQLGAVALLFGCFDLAASVSVSLFTDRIGKRRSILVGAGGALLGYALVPWLNIGLIPAVVTLAAARGFAEFFIVSILSLLSEQAPAQRARVMTLNVAAIQIGLTLAGFTGPWLYTQFNITGLALISCLVVGAAALVTIWWVRETTSISAAQIVS